MALEAPFPELDEFLAAIGAAGQRVTEIAAQYEYMDLVNGGQGQGLTVEELREVVRAFNVPTTLV